MSDDSSEKVIRCPYCDREDTVDGSLRTKRPARFVPDGASHLGTTSSHTEVSATMCLDCGRIWLWGDRQWVRKALGRVPPLPGG